MRIAVAIVLTAFSLKGGAVMKGRIVLNEIEGQAVKGVTVNAPGAANQTLSTENGTFTMEFPKLNPGDRVKLVLSQPGMEVVNWVQLDAVLAADYKGANELKLILAKGGRDREEMARRYFRLRSLEAVEANYRRLLGQAGQDGARLRRELDQAKSAVDRLAEELAKVKPGDASALYERAMRLYLEGKVTEAIEALDEAKLREMSQAALERKAQAEKQIAEVTRSWLLKGKLLTTQFRFPEAEKAYGEAVQLAPGDFEACFEQARFQQMLNRREASLETQTRCMRLAEISNKPRDVAASLRSIGDINTERDSIQEGLSIELCKRRSG